MVFVRSISVSATTALLVAATIVLAMDVGAARAQIGTFSVGADNPTSYPGNLPSFPDEHVTFVPSAPVDGYLVFASSAIQGGMGGAVVLQTQDLQTFSFATALGYGEQVINPPVSFSSCNPTYDTEFDENYVGPGTVVQDPTLPPGNLIMIYEAENHCPGGVNQFDYYATAGLARSADNGKTWPAPIAAEFGGTNRYPVLKIAMPEPTSPENPPMNLGDAIPTAYIDGNYIYIVYEYLGPPSAPSDNMLRIARANLVTDNVVSDGQSTLQFHKWYNGAFSQDGIGGVDSSPLPSRGCAGNQRQGSISHNDDLGLYVMIFVCINTQPTGQAAWYYATATSLDLENWTAPQMVAGSLNPIYNPCMGNSDGGAQFDGWYPSMMSPNAPQGHTYKSGRIYFLNGCDGGANRAFDYRAFAITGGPTIHDFNGDGNSDILWRDTGGDLAVWLMNGGTVAQAAGIGTVRSNIAMIGQKDFNGDRDADVLWRDAIGNLSMWFMNGAAVASAAAVGNVTTNWTLYGTGDLNGDGKGDLLWRDANSGTVAVWFMNGAAVASTANFGAIPTSWSIVDDANGDILWRDTAGDIALWAVQTGQVASSSALGTVPSNFVIQGVGDFNGDGYIDILWRETNSGALSVWFTNGAQVTSAASIGTLSSNWIVAQIGDYNGDGDSDILLRDSVGDLALWLMNGATVSSSLAISNVGLTWQVQNLNAN